MTTQRERADRLVELILQLSGLANGYYDMCSAVSDRLGELSAKVEYYAESAGTTPVPPPVGLIDSLLAPSLSSMPLSILGRKNAIGAGLRVVTASLESLSATMRDVQARNEQHRARVVREAVALVSDIVVPPIEFVDKSVN